jgi:hypothetical protein
MDSSTLALHRSVLRSIKGIVKAYEAWLDTQLDDAALGRLKALRRQATPHDIDTKTP